jgi:polyhydroxyalkanoate synthesis regulator phasin
MAENEKPDAVDKLVDAYEHMLKQTHETLEQAEKESVPAFREMLEKARDNMVELGELTREEAVKVAEYVERDIKDAASYIADTGEDLRKWWHFDVGLMEQRMLEMFSTVADQTSVQLRGWAEQARRASLYHTGEVSGPGALVCDACGAELHMHKTGRVPPCPKCHATSFRRPSEDEAPAA